MRSQNEYSTHQSYNFLFLKINFLECLSKNEILTPQEFLVQFQALFNFLVRVRGASPAQLLKTWGPPYQGRRQRKARQNANGQGESQALLKTFQNENLIRNLHHVVVTLPSRMKVSIS